MLLNTGRHVSLIRRFCASQQTATQSRYYLESTEDHSSFFIQSSRPGQSFPNPPASLLSRDISTSGNDPDILAMKNLEARQTRRRPPSFCRIERPPENGIKCARADIEIGAGTYGIVTPRGRQIDVRMDALQFNPGSQERRVYTRVRNNAQVPCTFEFSTPVVVGGTQHGPGQQHLEPGEECEIQGLVVPPQVQIQIPGLLASWLGFWAMGDESIKRDSSQPSSQRYYVHFSSNSLLNSKMYLTASRYCLNSLPICTVFMLHSFIYLVIFSLNIGIWL